jgi:hypothetical protein
MATLDRLIGAPMKRLISWAEKKVFKGMDSIHKISLSDPEEDYFTLMPIYACFLMILPFPFPEELGHLAFFDDQTPETDKERIMAFYKSCLQRHLYVRGTDKVLLSKNVSFGPMIGALNRTFPDCKIIGTVRNPLFAIPSHISSMMEGASFFDNDIQGNTFRNQMMEIQRYAYTHLVEALPRLPEHRQLMVKMEDLQNDLYNLISSMYVQFNYTMTSTYRTYLLDQDRKQKSYKSAHTYDLASYNLSKQDILNVFADVCHQFGYAPLD